MEVGEAEKGVGNKEIEDEGGRGCGREGEGKDRRGKRDCSGTVSDGRSVRVRKWEEVEREGKRRAREEERG